MNKIKLYKQELKEYGTLYLFTDMIPRKINRVFDPIMEKISKKVFKNIGLKNAIILESHNDFDSNGGAFYDWLIKNRINEKFKIIWLLRNKAPKHLPKNVITVPIEKPSIKKWYYLYSSKYLISCHYIFGDFRKNQISIYVTHGCISLKYTRGAIVMPPTMDYCLSPSPEMNQYIRKCIDVGKSKLVTLGYPVHDILYSNDIGDLHKITKKRYKKVILWMPTFRKTSYGRSDFNEVEPVGLPLFKNKKEYQEIDSFLKKENILLIIKIHPMQDLSQIFVKSTDNITILNKDDIKELGVDNYRLMKDVDGLISDYSSAAFDYLHCNKPIAYVLDDMNKFNLGFIVDDVNELIAGNEIYNLQDLKNFISIISNGEDPYFIQRNELFDRVFKYHDGKSCERLATFLNIKKE